MNLTIFYQSKIKSSIFYRNCVEENFGHYDFTLKLFDLFIEIWNAKVQLIKNELELDEYEMLQKEFKKRYREYRKEYLLNIQGYSENYPEDTIYKIHKLTGMIHA